MNYRLSTSKAIKSILFVILSTFVIGIMVIGQCTAKPLTTVRIAYTKKGDYLPMVVALQKKCFEKYGIRVDEVVVTGGIEAAEAVTTGSADIGLMGDVPALICTTSPNPGVIIATYASDEKRHHIVVAPGSKIKKPKDLEGKRFAVQHGSSTYGGLLMYCDKYHVNIKKINMVKISPRDMPEAMASGQIDAMAGSQPWPSNVIKRNPKAKELCVLSGLGCNYPLVIVSTKDMGNKRAKDTSRVLQAFKDAISFIHSNPTESAKFMAAQSGMKVEDELKDLKRTIWGLNLDNYTVSGLKKMAHFLRTETVLRRELNWKQAISYRFLTPNAKKSGK